MGPAAMATAPSGRGEDVNSPVEDGPLYSLLVRYVTLGDNDGPHLKLKFRIRIRVSVRVRVLVWVRMIGEGDR